jgi:hypothetical protein
MMTLRMWNRMKRRFLLLLLGSRWTMWNSISRNLRTKNKKAIVNSNPTRITTMIASRITTGIPSMSQNNTVLTVNKPRGTTTTITTKEAD